jgi:hypothetical protein
VTGGNQSFFPIALLRIRSAIMVDQEDLTIEKNSVIAVLNENGTEDSARSSLPWPCRRISII